MKQKAKKLPHDKDYCISQSRWLLIKLLDEKNEVTKFAMIDMLAEHLDHLT